MRSYTYDELAQIRRDLLKRNNVLQQQVEILTRIKDELMDDLIVERRKSSGHSQESMYFEQKTWEMEEKLERLKAQGLIP